MLRQSFCISLALSVIACDGVERPPDGKLEAVVSIGTGSDTAFGEFRGLTLLGCRIATVDRQARRALVFGANGELLARVGKQGSGPGEIEDPVVIAGSDDSAVYLMDIARRRLVVYGLDGRSISDEALTGGPSAHAAMGRLVYVQPGMLLDFWLSAAGPFPLQEELFDTVHLVYALKEDGTPSGVAWGRPIVPEKKTDLILRMGLQAGDLGTWRDTLFVLRGIRGQIDVFSIQTPTDEPVRSIQLRKWRRSVKPREVGTQVVHTPDGDRFGDAGEVVLESVASALAVSPEGHLYVVELTNENVSSSFPSPGEVLAEYSRDGSMIAASRLPTLATQDVKVLPDGKVVVLGIQESDSMGGRAILVFPGRKMVGRSCEGMMAASSVSAGGK